MRTGNQWQIKQGDYSFVWSGNVEIDCFSWLCRRLDPYARSCTILASLFAVGLVLIIIIVLSLIPLYISHRSKPAANDVFVLSNDIDRSPLDHFWYLSSAFAGLLASGYTLHVRSPTDDFDSNTVLNRSNNRQALQAALTSLIQEDAVVAGSLLEIYSSSSRNRRQASTALDVICDLFITSNRSCVSTICASQFQSSVANLLTGNDQNTSPVRYEQTTNTSSASTIYWFRYQLPAAMQWSKCPARCQDIQSNWDVASRYVYCQCRSTLSGIVSGSSTRCWSSVDCRKSQHDGLLDTIADQLTRSMYILDRHRVRSTANMIICALESKQKNCSEKRYSGQSSRNECECSLVDYALSSVYCSSSKRSWQWLIGIQRS